MDNYEIDYYFNNIDEFRYKDVFKGATYVWEVLKNIDSFLEDFLILDNSRVNLSEAATGEFVSITGNYFIDEGCKIGANVSIEGPVLIGKNVTIQSGALIRPGTIIGDNAVVGHCCEVKHSIVQNKAKIQSFTFIGDSLIGKSTRVGSGTILANRRFDQGNITVRVVDHKVDTNCDFFGAVIGDNSRLGANCTTVPGTFIGPYTWVLPTVQVRGFVPREKRLFPTSEIRMEDNPKVDLK